MGPLTDPICADARGASRPANTIARIAANAPDLLRIFMLHSPLHRGARPDSPDAFSLIIPLVLSCCQPAEARVSASSAGRGNMQRKKLIGLQEPPGGKVWGQLLQLRRMPATAASNCRTRRKPLPLLGNTTK